MIRGGEKRDAFVGRRDAALDVVLRAIPRQRLNNLGGRFGRALLRWRSAVLIVDHRVTSADVAGLARVEVVSIRTCEAVAHLTVEFVQISRIAVLGLDRGRVVVDVDQFRCGALIQVRIRARHASNRKDLLVDVFRK